MVRSLASTEKGQRLAARRFPGRLTQEAPWANVGGDLNLIGVTFGEVK